MNTLSICIILCPFIATILVVAIVIFIAAKSLQKVKSSKNQTERLCSQCGKYVKNGENFCTNCGAKIE